MVGNTSGFKVCPQCSASSDLNAAFCSVCGHSFQTAFGAYPRPGVPQPHWDPYAAQRPDSNKLLVTILLWFFLGHFGAHRFYLGYTNTAVVMLVLELVGLVTACILVGYIFLIAVFVWWIVDLIQILTGQLRPTDGSRLV